MFSFDVSYVGVVAAAVAQIIVGFAWYSKSMFGKQWASEMGFKMDDPKMKDGMGKMMAINLVMAVLMAFVLSNVVDMASAKNLTDGAVVGVWAWLGFILPLLVGAFIWEKKSQKLLTINAGYWLVTLAIMGGILTLV